MLFKPRLLFYVGIAALTLAATQGSTALAAAYLRGIDVSHYQGTIDWEDVKNDVAPSTGPTPGQKVAFAFLRSTLGKSQSDRKFAANLAGARANGIRAGAYHFAKPNRYTAAEEAAWFVGFVRKNGGFKPGDLHPVVDIEDNPGYGGSEPPDGVTREAWKPTLSKWVRDYAAAVKKEIGVYPIIYCNGTYAKNYLDDSLKSYPLWIASWSSKPPSSTGNLGPWSFWQWSDDTRVKGISSSGDGVLTAVDADVFRGTLTDLDKFTFPVPEPGVFGLLATGGAAMLGWFGLRRRGFRQARPAGPTAPSTRD